METILNLRELYNNSCVTNCNKEKRQDNTEDDVCKLVKSGMDELPIRCVGNWAYQKIYLLNQYFGIFAEGMKKKWNGLNYIEMCSGPGRCIYREDAKEFDGTSLSIINHQSFKFIKSALFIDYNSKVVDILNKRIKFLNQDNIAKAVVGDYNDISNIKKIISGLSKSYLNLVFIDPTDCSIPFNTIKAIKESLNKVDFIINFAHGTDLNRNLRPAIHNPNFLNAKEKYLKFLGTDDFFEKEDVKNYLNGNREINNLFFNEYEKNLRKIGFNYIEKELVEHYYTILFVTENKRGVDFWKKACKIKPDGQRTLF